MKALFPMAIINKHYRLLLSLLSTLLLILLTIYFYNQAKDLNANHLGTDNNPTTWFYRGKYVSVELPLGWNIREYSNQDGLEMSYTEENSFVGLTGLEIITDNNISIATFKGSRSTGGGLICNKVYKFNDTSNEYLNYIASIPKSYPTYDYSQYELINLSDNTYVEYQVLERNVRRIKNDFYWDTTTGDETFDPECGWSSSRIVFDALGYYFTGADNRNSFNSRYAFSVLPNTEVSELMKLDKVLESLSTPFTQAEADKTYKSDDLNDSKVLRSLNYNFSVLYGKSLTYRVWKAPRYSDVVSSSTIYKDLGPHDIHLSHSVGVGILKIGDEDLKKWVTDRIITSEDQIPDYSRKSLFLKADENVIELEYKGKQALLFKYEGFGPEIVNFIVKNEEEAISISYGRNPSASSDSLTQDFLDIASSLTFDISSKPELDPAFRKKLSEKLTQL